jgi:hypothetical protein
VARRRSRQALRKAERRQQAAVRQARKVVTQSRGTDWRTLTPSWSFQHLRLDGPYGWRWIDPVDLARAFDFLSQTARRKWGEIITQSGGHHHLIETADIVGPARDDLLAAIPGGADEVMSLRLTGRKRIFGYMEVDVMHVLWWDPEHEICPSER